MRSSPANGAGAHHNWRGLHEIPAVVRELDDRTAMCIALIENIQREDLNPLEQARGLARLVEDFDMTHDAVAESVGRSRSAVTNTLRLLELSEEVKRLLENRQLEMGHARALLTLSEQQQMWAAQQIVKVRFIGARRRSAGAAPAEGKDGPQARPEPG